MAKIQLDVKFVTRKPIGFREYSAFPSADKEKAHSYARSIAREHGYAVRLHKPARMYAYTIYVKKL